MTHQKFEGMSVWVGDLREVPHLNPCDMFVGPHSSLHPTFSRENVHGRIFLLEPLCRG